MEQVERDNQTVEGPAVGMEKLRKLRIEQVIYWF